MSSTTSGEPSLEELFAQSSSAATPAGAASIELFRPRPAETFKQAGVNAALAESLVCKFLLAHGSATGRELSQSLALPLKDLKDLLTGLKNQQLVYYKDSGQLDFTYALSESGRDRAKKYLEECTYLGAAPVPLKDYVESVARQTIDTEKPTRKDLERAFADLLINEQMFARLGLRDQLRPGSVSLWPTRKWQNQHRRAHHPLLRHGNLDSQNAVRRRPNHHPVRSAGARAGRSRLDTDQSQCPR